MKREAKILDIVKNKIMDSYREDISLLVVYGNNKDMNDGNLGTRFYFVPKSERGRSLSIQFIIEDVSYDLFPMRWERLVQNAAMDSPQGYILLDTEVIYYDNEESLERFNGLKNSLRVMLSGSYNEELLNKAYEYFNETYIYLYNMKKYETSLSSVRIEAGKLLDKIANALGFANTHYYNNGNGTILIDSMKLDKLPVDYKVLVDNILFASSAMDIYKHAWTLVENTRLLLKDLKQNYCQTELFDTLFEGYYEELKKSLNKCKHAVKDKNYYRLYELFSFIQEEVSQFMAKVEDGIWYNNRNAYIEYNEYFNKAFKADFLDLVSRKEDALILEAIEKFEEGIVAMIKDHKIDILEFDSVESFESYFNKTKG